MLVLVLLAHAQALAVQRPEELRHKDPPLSHLVAQQRVPSWAWCPLLRDDPVVGLELDGQAAANLLLEGDSEELVYCPTADVGSHHLVARPGPVCLEGGQGRLASSVPFLYGWPSTILYML